MWWAPSAVVAKAVPLGSTPVRRRPSGPRKVRPQGPSPSMRRVSGPLESSVTAPSRRVRAAGAASSPGSRVKSGPRRTFPAWWVARTPMTPSAGEKHSTVISGVLRVSPRAATRLTAAYAVNRLSSTRRSRISVA